MPRSPTTAPPRHAEPTIRNVTHLHRSCFSAAIREHRLFFTVLGAATVLRMVVAFTYRPAFFFTGDSVVYLNNSAHLVPDQARPILYPVFLRVVLWSHQLILVPILQHVLGLAAGVVTYALLRHLGVTKGIAILGTVFVLFDPLQLVLEENILSEALFQFLIVASLATLAWSRRPSILQCALVGSGLAAATVTRNVGLVLIVPAMGYALAVRFGWLRSSALVVAFAVPLLGYAGWFDATNGSFALQRYSGMFLYGRVAPFAECRGLHLQAAERALCPTTTPRSPWPTWYVFGPPSPFAREPLASDKDADGISMSFAMTIIRHQPSSYVAAVSKDFLDFFKPARSTGPDADPIVVDFVFRLNKLTAYPSSTITEWIQKGDQSPTAHAVIVRPLARVLIDWQRYFYFPGPLLALALVAGFAAAIGRRTGIVRQLGAEGVLYGACVTLLLLIPVATVVFDYRFLVPAFPLLGTSGAIGTADFIDRFRNRRSQAQSPRDPNGGSEQRSEAPDVARVDMSTPGPEPA
jgi:hypothetical protein